ncbi:N-acetylmuramoyl-L-alanine amidase [Chryseobacterium sp. Leaf394]|uniref:N-acetylmuramoyl-L-alanine amidase family protein n=1 Tax=Chryseobacterium sp. Leaf394 TaxID=1736361 RepID=UPI0006F7FF4E|nr:N-acetylmuramoyl-L-alanine amidase [Chryseobacterium sp. Leaf394]KQS91360.1 N-acetylmuramoyl-L-alanine amidase [Chryseobacterium sp. Leaf394]
MKTLKLFGCALFAASFLSFTPLNKKIIVIDAGHGGDDFGAQHSGFTEKEIVMNIAREIKSHNSNDSEYEIVLTRDSDTNSPLSIRTEIINSMNPVAVISLHVNSSPKPESDKQGPEIYTQSSEGSKKLAKIISKNLGECRIEEKNLHILRESNSPAVLVELGFINSTKDRKYLTSAEGQKDVAAKFEKIFSEL